MRSPKSPGITPSERLLAELAEKTFLKLWSYPNVFRAQGKKTSDGDGKELCDLLAVFGNHLIIFSDKLCAVPISGDLDLAWRRWYDRAIAKSAKQIFGAERWLKNFQQQVFVDRACKQQLLFCYLHPIVGKFIALSLLSVHANGVRRKSEEVAVCRFALPLRTKNGQILKS